MFPIINSIGIPDDEESDEQKEYNSIIEDDKKQKKHILCLSETEKSGKNIMDIIKESLLVNII